MEPVLRAPVPAVEEATYRKVTWRILPLLFLCYLFSYLDRVNVGFAKLQMVADLGFSETIYGLGAGVFFIGYFLFEVPSNVILQRVGARVWIARIMVTWGIISAGTLLVKTPLQFYAVRLLLGIAEAGFAPGVLLYLTYWYPAKRRGRAVAIFLTGLPMSGAIGGPLSGWLMKSLAGTAGLAGWQWLFLAEALPSVILGLVVFVFLGDGIRPAKWLTDAEKELLENNIRADAKGKEDHSLGKVLADHKVWLMSLIYFTIIMGLYGVSFWLPSIIKATGVKDPLRVGLLTAIPYLAAVVAMLLGARSADRRHERRWHTVVPAVLGAVGLLLSTRFGQQTGLSLACLTLATAGIISAVSNFWALPTAFLGGTAAAAGIAVVNAFGNLAGFVAPYLVGWVKDATGSTDTAVYVLAGSLVGSSILVLTLVPARLVDA
jgi:D-galactonate transporter